MLHEIRWWVYNNVLIIGRQMRQKLKTALRVPPGRFVQSLKVVSDSSRRCRYVQSFMGHRDGVWHVTVSRGVQPILASSSAGLPLVLSNKIISTNCDLRESEWMYFKYHAVIPMNVNE